MKRLVILLVLLSGLTLVQAQNQKQVQPQPPSMFDLNQIFGMSLDDMLLDMQKEMDATRDIWGQFIDPSFVDSTIMRLNDPAFGESLESLLQHFDLLLNEEEGVGGMLDDLLKNFNMPLNALPFNMNPDVLPEDFDGEGWDIIPNVPQPPATPQPKTPSQKKGVSVI